MHIHSFSFDSHGTTFVYDVFFFLFLRTYYPTQNLITVILIQVLHPFIDSVVVVTLLHLYKDNLKGPFIIFHKSISLSCASPEHY